VIDEDGVYDPSCWCPHLVGHGSTGTGNGYRSSAPAARVLLRLDVGGDHGQGERSGTCHLPRRRAVEDPSSCDEPVPRAGGPTVEQALDRWHPGPGPLR